jgi:hypothetical protein
LPPPNIQNEWTAEKKRSKEEQRILQEKMELGELEEL